MSEGGIGDLSRIVSLIMENPKLIEEISALATKPAEQSQERNEPQAVTEPTAGAREVSVTPKTGSHAREELLGALKPYLSPKRAGAIDSMISIAQILDVMKAR